MSLVSLEGHAPHSDGLQLCDLQAPILMAAPQEAKR